MKLRACAVLGLLTLTVSGAASSKPPRVTLATLALEEFSTLDASNPPKSLSTGVRPPELSVEVKKPNAKNRSGYGNYYETNGYTSTTVSTTAPDWCLTSSAGSVRREQKRDRLLVYGRRGSQPAMYPLNTERVVTEGNAAYLLARSYWVDAATGGLELVDDRKVKLTPVARREKFLDVYAFRGSRELHLVFRVPENSAMIAANGGTAQLGCGLKRLSFPLGERADLALSFALGLPEKNPKPGPGFNAAQTIPLAEAFRVSASISQTSRDPAPVISVTVAPTNATIRRNLERTMPRWTELVTAEELARVSQDQSGIKRR
jgi:hypothetical protein